MTVLSSSDGWNRLAQRKMLKRFKITISTPVKDSFPVEYRTKFIGAVSSLMPYEQYHGKGSKPYSVSDLQGVYVQDGHLGKSSKSDGVYFYVTSSDTMFVREFVKNFDSVKGKFNLYGSVIEKMESEDIFLNDIYDIVRTISPVLLRDNEGKFKKGWKYTLKDEKEWLTLLNDNAKRKIASQGYPTDGFKIELVRKIGNDKSIFIHETFNPTSMAILKVRGDYFQRELLFSFGLGGNTGIGFGALELKKLYDKSAEEDFCFD